MEQTVYVDLFFLVNFSMDFLCFYLTAKLLNREFSIGRALCGAAVGGVYADAALFFSLPSYLALCVDALAGALVCAIAFYQRRKAKALPLYVLVFVAISMALGGIMTALFHFFNRTDFFRAASGSDADGISVWIFALLAVVSGAITLLGGRFFSVRAAQRNAEVEITYEGKRLRLNAMTDNGNFLREPVSGSPCIVADLNAMSKILPAEVVAAAKKQRSAEWERIPLRHMRRIRMIPTRTAAGEGLLLGLRPERVTVACGGERREVAAWIALAELGKTAGGNEALLPAALLVS